MNGVSEYVFVQTKWWWGGRTRGKGSGSMSKHKNRRTRTNYSKSSEVKNKTGVLISSLTKFDYCCTKTTGYLSVNLRHYTPVTEF